MMGWVICVGIGRGFEERGRIFVMMTGGRGREVGGRGCWMAGRMFHFLLLLKVSSTAAASPLRLVITSSTKKNIHS